MAFSRRSNFSSTALATASVACLALSVVYTGCSSDEPSNTFADDAGLDGNQVLLDGNLIGADGATGDGFDNSKDYTDLPKAPIIDTDNGATTPATAGALFAAGPAAAGAGPCLSEPESGTRYPRNWMRPRFAWNGQAGWLYEITVKVDNQSAPLVVYTSQSHWTMPKAVWDALRHHSYARTMSVAVRGGTYDGSKLTSLSLVSEGDIGILPVDAPGSVIYWEILAGLSQLKGFRVGDESVVDALRPQDVAQQPKITCVGCHVSAPDGKYVLFNGKIEPSSAPRPIADYSLGLASVDPKLGPIGSEAPYMSAASKALLAKATASISGMSPAHWSGNDHAVITTFANDSSSDDHTMANPQFVAVQLNTGVVSKLARTGDPRIAAIAPAWTQDGTTVFYTSADKLFDGRADTGSGDIMSIPYAGGAGGIATPLLGASSPDYYEYYPSLSPDEKFVAFNRLIQDQAGGKSTTPIFNNNVEVFVVPKGGAAQPTKLAANSPPMCSGRVSPGVRNSWAKWAPAVPTDPKTGTAYYFLVFSSNRLGKDGQLFLAPMAVAKDGTLQSFSAVNFWNQNPDAGNHTPSWDFVNIPPVIPK